MDPVKFVMSYSCGKDSTLALHKMIAQGADPVALIVMFNEDAERSYFHGADRAMLEKYSEVLDTPLIVCEADGESYAASFETGLSQAKVMGATLACFGDIDIEANRQWEEDRCAAVGLTPSFPLWQAGREANVQELVDLGYRCLIKSVNTDVLPHTLLGRYIDAETIAVMKDAGIDICGENGEYHTLVTDGPIFKKPLDFRRGGILQFDNYAVIEVG